MESDFRRFLRAGGDSVFSLNQPTNASAELVVGGVNRRLIPNYSKLRRSFEERIDEIISSNNLLLLSSLAHAFDPPLTEREIPAVSSLKEAVLAEWDRRISTIWAEFKTHPVRFVPNRNVAEESLLRGFSGLINEIRQRQLGVTHYVWRSRDDGRVRHSHAEHDDRVFGWDNPPEGGHPGQAYNCRCHAEPVPPGEPVIVPVQYVIGADGMAEALPSPFDLGAGLRALTRGGLAALAVIGLEAFRRYADEAAVQRSAKLLGLDLSTVEGVLAARAHAWGQFHSGAFAGADWSGPSSEIVAQALALHELSDPGALGRAISGNQEDLAKILGLVEQALDAWRAGRLVVRPGEFASGWVEIFPQLDEFGRDILDLPGFSTDGYRTLGGTSSPHILESRPGDEPRSLPEGIPETDVEGIPVEPAPEGRGLPIQGPPDTWVVGPRGDRLYGPDGKPIKDVDWGHDHGQGQPHTHEWIDGERQPGRPATEDESFSGNGRGDDGQIKPEDWK